MFPRLRMLQVRNYKSLASVSVELEPFTVLIGPNGSGKSNVLDALSFVQEAVTQSVEMALSRRAGIGNILSLNEWRRPLMRIEGKTPEEILREYEKISEHHAGLGFRLQVELAKDLTADYSIHIAAVEWGGFLVAHERCIVENHLGQKKQFEMKFGRFEKPIPGVVPHVLPDRLALLAASATEDFRSVYDFIASMKFYDINPDVLRVPQPIDQGWHLRRDGSNAAAVWKEIVRYLPDQAATIKKLLASIVTGIEGVKAVPYGTHEILVFLQNFGANVSKELPALNISDGTLRILGLLLAIFQFGETTLLGIEEPEATIHPAIMDTLVEVFLSTSEEKQILITTHDPHILEHKDLSDDSLRLVSWNNGQTVVTPVPETLRRFIKEQMYSRGELLSSGELRLDEDELTSSMKEIDLFGPAL